MTTFPLNMNQCLAIYRGVIRDNDVEAMRELCKVDRFFLLTHVLRRTDAIHPWIFDRCREVEANPDSHLDLWSRGHYKSTIITFAGTLQEIIKNPEITIGIFSHTAAIARDFVSQLQQEMEENETLKALFPEIFWENPKRQAPKWGTESGLVVQRTSNPKEASIEGWGIVRGMPTGRHFDLSIYDDMVTEDSVTSAEVMGKTTKCWRISLNLGITTGARRWYIGTRYHFNDTYREMIESEAVTPRLRLCTDNGKENGEPFLLTKDELREKRVSMGPYVFGCQMLMDPVADTQMGFSEDWIKLYNAPLKTLNGFNTYLLVDPANEKKKDNDYTVMTVIALGPDRNYYLIDAVRDRMNLTERTRCLFKMHRKWSPIATGYEKYGMQSDVQHIKHVMGEENYRFEITELGGNVPKLNRITQLVPIFESMRFYLPERLLFIDTEKRTRDFVREFIRDEFTHFPLASHDDMLDNMARIVDPQLGAEFPESSDVDDSLAAPTHAITEYEVI